MYKFSHGGISSIVQCLEVKQCIFRMVIETKEQTEKSTHLQCQHEEADILLSFHTLSRTVLGSAIQNYGSDNHRRYNGVSELAAMHT